MLPILPRVRVGGVGEDGRMGRGDGSGRRVSPADADDTRAFLMGAGLGPDGAFRDRVVSPDGATLREVRVRASLAPSDLEA